MPKPSLVRTSRDGDQFHHLWAARRCLKLLSSSSGLVEIVIEQASPAEGSESAPGEQLIDVAEYYGSSDLATATRVRYIQLKHSTLRATTPWTPSELKRTLAGFAERYVHLREQLGPADLANRLQFWFVSNRPLSTGFKQSLDNAARLKEDTCSAELKKLQDLVSLNQPELAEFCRLLRFDCSQDDYWNQRNILHQELNDYLPGGDAEAALELKELVNRKALSESAENPSITRYDVLRALQTNEDALFPAKCLVECPPNAVPREQESKIIDQIVGAENAPVIIHADGGVGKSVFATQIPARLPFASQSVVYDCFGRGEYRNPTGYRHRATDGLVQIANQLAARGLCHPLIPTPKADVKAYFKAFLSRLKQSVAVIRARHPASLLCVIVDAADNAQMIAKDIGEARSFVVNLLRESMPEGVRLVYSCRTHRLELLDPPQETIAIELRPFSRDESSLHLRQSFPAASGHDVDEFHSLSSHNPRVQALALSYGSSLQEILISLGPEPTTVDKAINDLLEKTISKVRDSSPSLQRDEFDRICLGLSVLRPRIPISVLAQVSGVPEPAVRSFVFDLLKPLRISGDSVQFSDEPTETWFRERFRSPPSKLSPFLEVLKPIAATSSYVASVLPQLLLEAGRLDELVGMALSSTALPTNPLDKQQVELQRLQFALKAALRQERYSDAVMLALKAGNESAGDERQQRLLQANTDLAAVLLSKDQLGDLAAQGTLGSSWPGSRYAYQSCLMSFDSGTKGEARSRLRMAEGWLRHFFSKSRKARRNEQVSSEDVAELAIAHFNLHGPSQCARFFRGWKPRMVSFSAGRILARRLVDHSRYADLDDLAIAAGNNVWLILAITLELNSVRRSLTPPVAERSLRLLRRPCIAAALHDWDRNQAKLQAVTALAITCFKFGSVDSTLLATLLTHYLPEDPPRDLNSRFDRTRLAYLRAYALRAEFSGTALSLNDLAHSELRERLATDASSEASEFKADIGALLPWHRLWAKVSIGAIPAAELAAEIDQAASSASKSESLNFGYASRTANEVARVWHDILLLSGDSYASTIDALWGWLGALKSPLYTTTLTSLARSSAHVGHNATALRFAHRAAEITAASREDADARAELYVGLSRAVLPASSDEGLAYFDEAVRVAGKLGDESLSRWDAILDLADRAGGQNDPAPEVAYYLARCAELTHEYVRDKHFDWNGTVRAIASICPPSSLAILSRWRDRGFGRTERLLPWVTEYLVECGYLTASSVLPLIGFRYRWTPLSLLETTLEKEKDQERRVGAASFAYRYMSLETQTSATWQRLEAVASRHGIVLDGLSQRVVQNQPAAGEDEDLPIDPVHSDSETPRDWGSVFMGIDFGQSGDLVRAWKRYRDLGPPWPYDDFFTAACSCVPAGRESQFLRAVGNVSEFELTHLRSLLECMPTEWTTRIAVRPALADTLMAMCRRGCMTFSKNRHFELFPLGNACDLAGINEQEVIRGVLHELGQRTEPFDTQRLFSLVGLLVLQIHETEAITGLNFGLELFEGVLDDSDGDGPWNDRLAPPKDAMAALTGYVWAALAAPRASLRWEAAHVVRGWCQLHCETALDHLMALAAGGTGTPFVDARLSFYDLHARQWLLIGLVQGAKDAPEALAGYVDFLMEHSSSETRHVLIRGLAADAILALADAGSIQVSSYDRRRLEEINHSPFPREEENLYERRRKSQQTIEASAAGESKFFFWPDFGPYWYSQLALHFALSQAEIEQAATGVIKKWPHAEAWWNKDPRVYQEGETHHSHRSYPQTDDAQFYLSYHAMFVVAGDLLSSRPERYDTDQPEDSFASWLSDYGTSGFGGRWLYDRRDPKPLDIGLPEPDSGALDWRWSVRREDFDHQLFRDDWLFLWGKQSSVIGSRAEIVGVSSTLVSPAQAESLLCALYEADYYEYCLPSEEDHRLIRHGAFQQRGWIVDEGTDSGLDGLDPWAGSISCPPIVPAPFVVDLMALRSDGGSRAWALGDQPVMQSEIWGEYDKGDHHEERDGGRRLLASRAFVTDLLASVSMDMIVEVTIERRATYSRYSSSKDEKLGYIPPSARHFLIKSSGGIYTI